MNESTFADVLRDEDRAAQYQRQQKWDERWMRIAAEVATWSKDPGHKVGACVVHARNQTVVSTGYNGFPRQLRDENLHCRPAKLARTVHAEVNAMIQALRSPFVIQDCTLYVSGLPPCEECAKLIIQCGLITRIVADTPIIYVSPNWRDRAVAAQKMFREAGIEYEMTVTGSVKF